MINHNTSVDLNNIFSQGLDAISSRGKELQAKMDAIIESGKEISPEDMLVLQMEMGQYNTLMESISTVSKSLTDTMKSIAQKAG